MAVPVLEPNAHTGSMPTHYAHGCARTHSCGARRRATSLIRGTWAAVIGTGSPERNVDMILSPHELSGSAVPLGCLALNERFHPEANPSDPNSQTQKEGEQVKVWGHEYLI